LKLSKSLRCKKFWWRPLALSAPGSLFAYIYENLVS
jgi:hypothetical protein